MLGDRAFIFICVQLLLQNENLPQPAKTRMWKSGDKAGKKPDPLRASLAKRFCRHRLQVQLDLPVDEPDLMKKKPWEVKASSLGEGFVDQYECGRQANLGHMFPGNEQASPTHEHT